jgi:GNAT superfamily N-acetyltransferase
LGFAFATAPFYLSPNVIYNHHRRRFPPGRIGAPVRRVPGLRRAFLAERLEKRESVVYLAADAETHGPLGFVQLYPLFSSVSVQRLWIVNDLFVLPAARKRGVAAALLERCRTLARDTGAKGLQLETGTDNLTAQRLYERTGFTRIDAAFYFLKT